MFSLSEWKPSRRVNIYRDLCRIHVCMCILLKDWNETKQMINISVRRKRGETGTTPENIYIYR